MPYINCASNRDKSAATVPEFVAECCILDPASRMSSAALYWSFERWNRAQGLRYWISSGRFTLELSKLGPFKLKTNTIKWVGVRLNQQEATRAAEEFRC